MRDDLGLLLIIAVIIGIAVASEICAKPPKQGCERDRKR